MKRTRPALAVVCALLLAGCSAFGAPGTPSPTAEPSPTPSATPTDTPAGEYPPGLAPGDVDAFALADAHSEVLTGRFYTVAERREIQFANGTRYTRIAERTRMTAAEPRYRYDMTVDGTARTFLGTSEGTLIHASNGTVVAEKVVTPAGTSYDLVETVNGELAAPATVRHGTPTNREAIAVALDRASNVSVEPTGEGAYLVRATDSGSDAIDFATEEVRNATDYELTMTVTADGLVRAYRLTFAGSLDGEPVTVVQQVDYSALGETTVEKPPWWEKAVSNHSTPPSD